MTLDELLAERERAVTSRDVEIFGVATNPDGKPLLREHVEIGLVESGTRAELADALKLEATTDRRAWVRAAAQIGMTRAETVARSGLSRQSVYEILTGKHDPTEDEIEGVDITLEVLADPGSVAAIAESRAEIEHGTPGVDPRDLGR